MIRALVIACTAAVLVAAQPAGSRPLVSLTSEDFADLQFLRARLANVQVVQLGEAGHGMGEVSQLKTRLVRFLHKELGFTVMAFESSMFLAHQADAKAATTPAQSMLTSSLIGVWHTREVLPLFELIKASRATDRPLRLAGFDVQPIGSGKTSRPAFLRGVVITVDEPYAAEVEAFDTTFLAEYDKGSASRRAYLRDHRDQLVNGYTRLASFIDSNLARIETRAGREAALVAAQEARSMVMFVRQQTAPDNKAYAELRDEGMAENVRFLERLFPNQKIIVWAHNYHIAHATAAAEATPDVFPGVPARSMGNWMRERLGDRVYSIGMYPYEGRAVDNSRMEYAIEKPLAESLEGRIATSPNAPAVFVDIEAAVRAGGTWLRTPIAARFEGRSSQKLTPADQYDAVIVVGRVSPPVFLY